MGGFPGSAGRHGPPLESPLVLDDPKDQLSRGVLGTAHAPSERLLRGEAGPLRRSELGGLLCWRVASAASRSSSGVKVRGPQGELGAWGSTTLGCFAGQSAGSGSGDRKVGYEDRAEGVASGKVHCRKMSE